jgi:hypothetical protein
MRRLISTRRFVDDARLAEYEAAWGALVTTAAGMPFRVNAWRFRSAGDARGYIEFLEFSGEVDPRGDAAMAAGLTALEAVAAGNAEVWVDPLSIRD